MQNNADKEPKEAPVSLAFSDKYSRDHSRQYFEKHQAGFARRLSNWRDMQIARTALHKAGDPAHVLDLPCGAGRFWPLLLEKPDRKVLAADNSADMIAIAREHQPPEIVEKVETFQTSAFAIDLPDNAVQCVFSMRLLHHVQQSEHRLTILREYARVASESVILSLWVDGNYKAWRRRRLERRREQRGEAASNANRFIVAREQIEAEFREAGLEVIARLDFAPKYAMWRTYVLRKRT